MDSPVLAAELARYRLVAGTCRFESDPARQDNGHPGSVVRPDINYLLFRPRIARTRLPVVVFLPGLGELGDDLSLQFHQRTIFEVVTSPAFQRRHPCYLLVAVMPRGADWHCRHAGCTTPVLSALAGTIATVMRGERAPGADPDRTYLTGLSAGGGAAGALVAACPGCFAAAVSVANTPPPSLFPSNAANLYVVLNQGEERRTAAHVDFDAFAARLAAQGGDFRLGTLTGHGHNAWDEAWREDALWDWMFSKALPTRTSAGRHAEAPSRARMPPRADCTASVSATSDLTGPDRATDGLEATAYVASRPVRKGDWWQAAYRTPVRGLIVIRTGRPDGADRPPRVHAEFSRDGRSWSRAGRFHNGDLSFSAATGIRFVRLIADADGDGPLVIREVVFP